MAALRPLPALALLLCLTGCVATPDDDDSAAHRITTGPTMTLGTWNMRNFSEYGLDEWRLDTVVPFVDALPADLIAIQELKPDENGSWDDQQALDFVIDSTHFEGLHNPWRTFDTSVGLLYDPDIVTVVATEELFAGDSWAFPRPPLRVDVEVSRGDRTLSFTVFSLHLKAQGDDVERRRLACAALNDYVREQGLEDAILLGDLNDDPHDPEEDNAFLGTLLGEDPYWRFLTEDLPPESVTSTGWYHWVGDEQIQGEFIDHAIARGPLADRYASITPEIRGVPESEYQEFRQDYSDHFPVLVRFE